MVSPPRPRKVPHRRTLHGVSTEDPYHWLRDDNWQLVMRKPDQLAPEIREHLDRENDYTAHVMEPTAALRQALFEELKGRIKEDDSSVPAKDGPFEYYARYELGAQHPRYCRRPSRGPLTGLADKGASPDEQVMFDADAAAKPHAYFSTGAVVHSPSHGRLGYAIDTKGSEYYEIRFRELDGLEEIWDCIESTSGQFVFSADGGTIFYTAVDENHRPSKVYRHRIGTSQSEDTLVYDEPDPGFFVSVDHTEDRRFVVITAHDHVTSEQRLIDAARPEQAPRLIAERRAGIEYSISSLGDELLLLTNDGARDFKLAVASLDDPGPTNWREIVPHRPGTLIVAAMTYSGHIVRLERTDGLPRVVVRSRVDGAEHTIAFDEEAYSLGLSGSYEYDTQLLRFTYSSLTTPQQTYDYDMSTRARVLIDQREIPSGHDPKRYRSARVLAPSHDGELVPVSLLWHEQTELAGAPLLLYGYGAYGHSLSASFSSNSLSLVNRGFIHAIAHVRGGKDKGYAWYEDGKLLKKKNSFLDFVYAAEHLCRLGYTRPGEITIQGGSAGGMLVGAALNLRPDLFRAAALEVPFVDVLNTMCDPTLPLTPPEWPEWGNPIESAEAYAYIASYSPYDNLQPRAYPHVLATAGLTDPRVTYWEPAKWVARMRELRVDDRMLLLRTYMEAGHGGAAGRYEKLEQVAFVQAFILLAHDAVAAEVRELVGAHEPRGPR